MKSWQAAVRTWEQKDKDRPALQYHAWEQPVNSNALKTAEQKMLERTQKKYGFNDFEQRQYDCNDLEKKLLKGGKDEQIQRTKEV